MVAVAILAIVGGLAYPLYEAQNRKSNRPLAITALEKIAQAEQRFMSERGVFTETLTDLPGLTAKDYTSSRYNLAVKVTGNQFVATATAIGGQANDSCTALSLDSVGHRNGLPTRQDCWGK